VLLKMSSDWPTWRTADARSSIDRSGVSLDLGTFGVLSTASGPGENAEDRARDSPICPPTLARAWMLPRQSVAPPPPLLPPSVSSGTVSTFSATHLQSGCVLACVTQATLVTACSKDTHTASHPPLPLIDSSHPIPQPVSRTAQPFHGRVHHQQRNRQLPNAHTYPPPPPPPPLLIIYHLSPPSPTTFYMPLSRTCPACISVAFLLAHFIRP